MDSNVGVCRLKKSNSTKMKIVTHIKKWTLVIFVNKDIILILIWAVFPEVVLDALIIHQTILLFAFFVNQECLWQMKRNAKLMEVKNKTVR